MSDLSIPGVGTSKYGTEKLIEGLMKLERVPRDKAAERLKALDAQKTVWLDLNQRLTSLRESARSLYSFKNPFSERIATSSDEEALTATATREALEQTRTVVVERPAAADRFLSSELAKDYRVDAGTYSFTVGDRSLDLKYGGGSLQDFSEALTRKGAGLLRAQVISVKPGTVSLVIESLKTGAANRLGFSGEAEKLALRAGMLEKVSSTRRDLDPAKPVAWERPLDRSLVKVDESGALTLVAGAASSEAKLAIQPPVKSTGMSLELEYRLVRLPQAPVPTPPPGPSVGPTGSVTYEGITVASAPSATGLPDWVPPPRPPVVEDRAMASLVGPDGGTAALPELEDGEGVRTLSVPLSDYLPEAAALAFRVRDTTRRLEIVRARVLDPTEVGGYRPLRPVSTAQDALFSVDGIEATRPSNAVSDIVPGVTLNLKAASEKPVKLKVEPDRDAAKESVIKLVGFYNRLMAEINILTRPDEAIVAEIDYFSDEERKAAKERLGLLQGDSTLSLLKSSLQRSMTSPYETRDGQAMALLSQLGVASDARAPGSVQGYDKTKMRGYLEIDEDTLKKALGERFEAVKELFGYDSDGDLIVNSGVAFALDGALKPYVETGGNLSVKTGTIDAQRAREKTSIETMDRQLAAKEEELKRKYGQMEGALNRMEGTSSSIENFNNMNKD